MNHSRRPHNGLACLRKQVLNIFRNTACPLVLFSALFLCALFAQQGHAAEENSPELLAKRYNLAKIYFHNLTTYGNIARSRVKWENTIRKFRKIYLAVPKQELGMSSLFMMGRIYHEMSWRFNSPHDLDEAIAYYEDVAILFPESELADDALYLLGWIYLNDKEDKQHAAVTFYQITCQ